MAQYYVAHRLFSLHDRALGAYLADQLARRVGTDAVFLPFCDTNEEDLADPCKGRRLYELDRQRLAHVDKMLAVLHGPSLDDGVCMEIGYAAALGVPVVALTTDFQTYGLTMGGPALDFPDPLLHSVLAKVIRVCRLAVSPEGTYDRYHAFLRRNVQPLREAADRSITALQIARPTLPIARTDAARRQAYIEPSPYAACDIWQDATRLLTSRGWDVRIATRFRPQPEPLQAAAADWAAAQAASLALIDTAGPETPPGAALIAGACAATGRRVLALPRKKCWTFAEGREPNWRNLMVQYAVTGEFADLSELAALLAAR